jgi:hypothetical protein
MTIAQLQRLAGDLPCGLVRSVGHVTAPLWLLSLIAPEIHAEFDSLSLAAQHRYFAARSAPLGTAPAPIVVSTFFNFSPKAINAAIPAAWASASPQAVLDAQLRGIDRALLRAFAETDPAIVSELATLLRQAAETAAGRPEGRPLFAAYSALQWPEEAHLQLWHAHYLLREFRGDGHIAALVNAGLTGLEALILHIALVPAVGPIFRSSRAWTDEQWDGAVADLTSEGWLDPEGDLALSPLGAERREAIELRTDELDLPAWEAIGATGCERVVTLSEPINAALAAAGLTFSFG